MAKRRRKKRTHQAVAKDPAKKGDPKSFVFRRGRHGLIMADLEADLRKVMSPNTASHLRESKRNVLKDFVHIAGPLGVTHFLILTATQNASYLRIAKSPRGPTLTMRVHSYALMRDVAAAQQRPSAPQKLWGTAPLLVMNNFGGSEHLKLATVLFQNLFPTLNVSTVRLANCQRVVLLDHDKETGRISFRHFSITVAPSGVSKGIKTLVGRRTVPAMGGMADVSEFLIKSGYGSESEGEEAGESRVTLAQDLGKGNLASRQSRVQLQEIGPRMELEIVKVEEGLCDGKVLFHAFESKSRAEVAAMDSKKTEEQKAAEEKEARRKHQEENVRRKAAAKAATEAEKGDKPKKKPWWQEEIEHGSASGRVRSSKAEDDIAAYREEVGEEPEEDFGARPSGTGKGGADRHKGLGGVSSSRKQHAGSRKQFDGSRMQDPGKLVKKRSRPDAVGVGKRKKQKGGRG